MKIIPAIIAGLISTAFLSVSSAVSQSVTLNSIDGTITLTGELTGFDGENYQITTALGNMSVSSDQVTCQGDACPDLISLIEEFSIAGSNAIGTMLLPTLIEAYALERGGDLQVEFGSEGSSKFLILNPDGTVYSTITIMAGSSDDAFAALADKSATIGLSSRRASDSEITEFSASGNGNLTSSAQETIIALDGIIVVTHRNNPISTLSLGQITQVFAGEITNWAQLGGLNAPISLYRRDGNSGTTSVFNEIAMAPNGHRFSISATIMQSNAAVSDAVGRDINGIGISAIADERNARAMSLRAVCGQVYAPSDFTIKTEEYPLSRRLFLYTNGGPRPDRATELINFISSDIAQKIAENSGFVGQNVMSLSLDKQGRRIANAIVAENGENALANVQSLLSTLLDAERLSLTLRFISGTSTLDNRALGDIDRLADLIKGGEFANRQILVLGFTDNTGSDDDNLRLSQLRAEQARDSIVAATGRDNLGNIIITPVGFGRISPLGCNETGEGRSTNRRVELWIR